MNAARKRRYRSWQLIMRKYVDITEDEIEDIFILAALKGLYPEQKWESKMIDLFSVKKRREKRRREKKI